MDELEEFAKWLGEKHLEICSFSYGIKAYWPNEGTSNSYWVERFRKENGLR